MVELLNINSERQTEVENSGDESDDSVALLSLSGDEFVIPAHAQRSSVKKCDDRAKNNIDTEDDDTAGRERALLSVPAAKQVSLCCQQNYLGYFLEELVVFSFG